MNPGALAVVPVVLAGVLILSGALKVGGTERTRASLLALRIPLARRLPWAAALVPWAEITLGAALVLLPAPAYAAAGWAAVAVFAAFTVAVTAAAARDDAVECNCFGALSVYPVSWPSVVRNALLTAAALLVAVGGAGRGGVIVDVAAFDNDELTWFVVTALTALALAALWVSNRSLALRLREGPASEPMLGGITPDADFSAEELVAADGTVMRLRRLTAGSAVLLVFVQVDCAACGVVALHLAEWSARLAPSVRVVVATSATPEELVDAYPELAPTAFYGGRGARKAFGIESVPAAVLLGRDSRVAAGPVYGATDIGDLVGGIREALAQPRA